MSSVARHVDSDREERVVFVCGMRTQRLGAKGPELSVIGFGAWEAGGDAWGPNRSESEVIDAIVSLADGVSSVVERAHDSRAAGAALAAR